jgi:hypothetical protein
MNTNIIKPGFRAAIIVALLLILIGQTLDVPSEARYGRRRAAHARRVAHRQARHARARAKHLRKESKNLQHKIGKEKKAMKRYNNS